MIQDLQFAARMLVKDKWFTLVAVLALGLGIGLNATVFTFVNAVLIRGLPFHHPEQIFYISGRTLSNNNQSAISWLDFEELRGRTKTFAGLAAYRGGNFTVTESGHPPERIQGVFVTANTFGLLGQQPLLGRDFVPGEDKPDAAPVAHHGIQRLAIALRRRSRPRRTHHQSQRHGLHHRRDHAGGHEVSEQCRPVAPAGRERR